ncbi:MAG: hypothetical protein K2V38_11910, partial [Gemmataceae bacterium]|nr:hypothetical protein [Gemmataceae bacterium]
MYSVVLMTALTTAPDVPQFNGYFRDLFSGNSCSGCNGCNGGGVRYSCYGGGCSGSVAYPASCNGCCGYSCHGGIFGLGLGDRMRSFFARDAYGCCGSNSYNCTGYSCNGYAASCFGSAYSCFGGPSFGGGYSCQGGLTYPPPMLDTFPPMPGQGPGPFAQPYPADPMYG